MKRLRISLMIFILLVLPGMSLAEEDTWTRSADMPTARFGVSTCVVDGKIYAIAGGQAPYTPYFSIMEVYDPATDTWTAKADMPTARYMHSTSAVNGKIYAVGGSVIGWPWVPNPTVEVYDTGVGIRVRAISPEEGRVAGGEPITILGKNLPPGVRVTIGGKPLTQVRVTDTLITGITPPGTEGECNIPIRAPGIDFTVFAGKFFYYPPSGIVMRSVIPTNGKQAGGDVGSVTGRGFLPGATVTIGGIPATDVGVTPTLVTFTIPPGREGAKDVAVTNPDGQKGILRGGYTYNPFRASEGTIFRYVTNARVDVIIVRIFNLRGAPIGIVRATGSNEVRWHNPSVHVGIYVYLLEARLEDGQVRKFKNMLEVCK